MQCEGFERRLNQLLDERRCLESDGEMTAHLADCAECRALLAGYELLLEGLDARPEIDPPHDLAVRVSAQLLVPPSRSLGRVAGALALAASLLIAVAAWLWSTGDSTAPAVLEPATIADTNNPEAGAPDTITAQAAPDGTVVSEDEISLEYRAMLQRTGQAMATLPDTMRRTQMRPEIAAVAEGFRPVAASFSAVLGSLRRTLPSKSDGSKS